MNNEIKEIINNLRKTADNSLFVVCSSQEELDKIPKYTANFSSVNDRQAKILLDYITNLQEEIEKLQERIDKATGIANERINYCYHENDKEQLESWEEIFDILQGIDANE